MEVRLYMKSSAVVVKATMAVVKVLGLIGAI